MAKPDRSPEPEVVRRMGAQLIHRGPDEEGLYVGQQSAMAMRRLAIQDLTLGQLPIRNEDETIFVVFNGEIYNFRELYKSLVSKGHRFRTKTDTEVIVHLFEDSGITFIDDLDGMFSIALWDTRDRTLWLVRDRLGKKPLFYYVDDDGIRFGSEIKAILADPTVPREVDNEAVAGLLTLGYSPQPLTFYKRIRELPPGHFACYRDGRLDVRSYWSPPVPKNTVPNDVEQRLESLIDEAVSRRLVSDVPLGVFLSGGLDSSLIVASMAHQSSTDIKTFSISFDDPDYDETSFARLVANRFNTDHHEFQVKSNLFDVLPKLVWHHDGPFADSSAIPTYFVSKLAREHVTVALTGDGGDEIFGGYDMYRAHKYAQLWTSIPTWLRNRIIRPIVNRLSHTRQRRSLTRIIREFDMAASLSLTERHARWLSVTKTELRKRLFTGGPLEPYIHDAAEKYLPRFFEEVSADDPVAAAMYADVRSFLPGDMLVKVDRASMAASLETRSPLLDHRLVEFMSRLPGSAKISAFRSKALLKKTVAKRLPRQIVYRAKRGFRVPVASWFKDEYHDYVRSVLLSSNGLINDIVNRDVVTGMLDEHGSGYRDYSRELFTLLTIELGYQTFLRKSGRG